MRTLLKLCSLIAATLLFSNTAIAQAPQPITSKSGLGVETFVGWKKVTSGLPKGVKYLHRPGTAQHKGSALWFYDHPTNDLKAAVIASAKAGGITNVKILASHPMPGAKLIDKGGQGVSFIADGTRNGKPYRIAAMALYGRMTVREKRSTGVHTFVAPREKYASMGGWVVPASLWLNLDPAKEVADSRAQGSAPAKAQAQRLSGVGNIWAKWALQTYIQMQTANLAAMESARKTIVCSGDPSCEIVPGY
ncbi:MAG: hypothetical protein AAGK17_10630 [Pseudomonadota bacterium]